MIALYIICAVILIIIGVLSIKIKLKGEYYGEFNLSASWLFLNFHIYPALKSKSPKKNKDNEKENKPEPDSQNTENSAGGENIFKKFYKNQGFDGVVELINEAAYSVSKMLKSLRKHIVIQKLFIYMTVSSDCDAAETAVEYGRMCRKIFPALAFICSQLTVRKYNAEIEPDFLGKSNRAEYEFEISVRPLFLLNAAIVLAVRLLFNVVIKFFLGIKDKFAKEDKTEKGGAL